jgi:hypothetical protein
VVEDDPDIPRPGRLAGALLPGTVVGDLGELASVGTDGEQFDGSSVTSSEPTSLVQSPIRSSVGCQSARGPQTTLVIGLGFDQPAAVRRMTAILPPTYSSALK